MRYLVVLLLAGCAASNWTKEGSSSADLDRDYDECRQVAASGGALVPAALTAAFGAVGVLIGTSSNDERIRQCLSERGWKRAIQAY
jgi:hypothetical protein